MPDSSAPLVHQHTFHHSIGQPRTVPTTTATASQVPLDARGAQPGRLTAAEPGAAAPRPRGPPGLAAAPPAPNGAAAAGRARTRSATARGAVSARIRYDTRQPLAPGPGGAPGGAAPPRDGAHGAAAAAAPPRAGAGRSPRPDRSGLAAGAPGNGGEGARSRYLRERDRPSRRLGSAPHRSCRAVPAVRGPNSSRRRHRPHLPRDPPAPRSAPCAASGRLCKMAALPGETTAGAAWGGRGGAPAFPALPAPPAPPRPARPRPAPAPPGPSRPRPDPAAGVPSGDAQCARPRRPPARRPGPARRCAAPARMGLVEALGAGAARLLFYPSLLYTVARARLPGSRRPWFHRIDEVVVLGALPLRGRIRGVRRALWGGPGRAGRNGGPLWCLCPQLVAEENVRGVVTLTEDYETRFLCFSPEVSPGISGVSPRPGLSSLSVPAQVRLWPPPVIPAATAKSCGSKAGTTRT